MFLFFASPHSQPRPSNGQTFTGECSWRKLSDRCCSAVIIIIKPDWWRVEPAALYNIGSFDEMSFSSEKPRVWKAYISLTFPAAIRNIIGFEAMYIYIYKSTHSLPETRARFLFWSKAACGDRSWKERGRQEYREQRLKIIICCSKRGPEHRCSTMNVCVCCFIVFLCCFTETQIYLKPCTPPPTNYYRWVMKPVFFRNESTSGALWVENAL